MASANVMTRILLGSIIGLTVGSVLVAELLPIALDQFATVNATDRGWNSAETSLFTTVMPILVVVVPIAIFAKWAMDSM